MFKRLIKKNVRLTNSINSTNNQIRSYFETAFPIPDSENTIGGVILKFKKTAKMEHGLSINGKQLQKLISDNLKININIQAKEKQATKKLKDAKPEELLWVIDVTQTVFAKSKQADKHIYHVIGIPHIMSAFYDGQDLSIIEDTAVSKYFSKIKDVKDASISTEENNKLETIVLFQQDFKTEAIYHPEETVRRALLVDSDGDVSKHSSEGTRYLLIIKAKYLSITPEMVREAHMAEHKRDLSYDRLINACVQYFQRIHTGKENEKLSTQEVAVSVPYELTQNYDSAFSENLVKVAYQSGLAELPTRLGKQAVLSIKLEDSSEDTPSNSLNKF